MNIIDYECLACASFKECGTEVGKGSFMCAMKRTQNGQTKQEMLQKMYDITKMTATKGADVLEMLGIRK